MLGVFPCRWSLIIKRKSYLNVQYAIIKILSEMISPRQMTYKPANKLQKVVSMNAYISETIKAKFLWFTI